MTETEKIMDLKNVQFKELFKNIPIPTYTWKKEQEDLILIDYNIAALEITEGHIKDFVGFKASEMYKNDKEILEDLNNCANEEVNISKHMKYFMKTIGKEIFLSVKYSFVPPNLVMVHTEDITKQKQAEQKLTESEEKLRKFNIELEQRIKERTKELTESEEKWRSITKYTPDHILMMDRDAKVLFINYTVPDLTVDEVIGRSIYDFVQKEYQELQRKEYDKILNTGEPSRFETGYVDKDGNQFYFEVHSGPVWKEGKVIGIINRSTDITERKLMEQKLKESETKYRSLFDNMLDGFAYCKIITNENNEPVDFIYLEINDAFERLTGLKKENTISKRVTEVIPGIEHSEPNLFEIYGKVALTGEPTKFEIFFEPLKIWLSIAVYSPQKGYFVAVFENITERKLAEQKLKESESKLDSILSAIPDQLIMVDKDLNISYANRVAKEIYGQSIEGDKCFKIFHDYNDPCPDCHVKKTFNNGKNHSSECMRLLQDGSDMFCWCISSVAATDKNGEPSLALEISRDITEFKIAEQKLKESEEKYRLISENANDLIAILNDRFEYEYVNENVLMKLLGYSKDEIMGKTPPNLIHLDDLEIAFKSMKLCSETGECQEVLRFIKKDGSYIWFDINGKTYLNNKRKKKILIISRDITERKEAEQELKESEEKFRSTFEQVAVGIAHTSPDGNFLRINQKFCDILGYTREELLSLSFQDITHPDDVKGNVEAKENLLSDKIQTYSTEKRYICKDGSLVWVNLTASVKRGANGVPEYFIAVVEDISKKKKAEDKLKESEHRYRSLYESSKDGIVRTNMEGKIQECNQAYADMVGYTMEEIKELTYQDLTPKKWHEIEDEIVKNQFIARGYSDEYEKEYIKKDGKNFPVALKGSLLRDKNGKPIGMQGYVRDITMRKKAEKKISDLAKFPSQNPNPVLRVDEMRVIYSNKAGKELFNISKEDDIPESFHDVINVLFSTNENRTIEIELNEKIYSFILTKVEGGDYVNIYGSEITEIKEAQEELINLNKLKSKLLTRASHELKTPLISIKGYSDLLLELHKEKFDDMALSSLKQIKRGCDTLEKTVNNILNTTYLDSGKVSLNLTVEDLSFLIKFVVNDLKGLALTRNHEISMNIQNDMIVKIEKERIYEVLSNLVVNAIKYTPPGGHIEIKSESKNGFYVISVKDSGIGFAKEEKELIFKQFGKIERYGQGWDVGIEGTGLGLYISKKIIELHGGKIWMESKGRNKGATFYFSLPIT